MEVRRVVAHRRVLVVSMVQSSEGWWVHCLYVFELGMELLLLFGHLSHAWMGRVLRYILLWLRQRPNWISLGELLLMGHHWMWALWLCGDFLLWLLRSIVDLCR